MSRYMVKKLVKLTLLNPAAITRRADEQAGVTLASADVLRTLPVDV